MEAAGDRTVLVGVTGGIAIYKAVELVRGLVKDGLQPIVVTS
jgi:phosphopantothenoylcysteine synthetase/decarboxylase